MQCVSKVLSTLIIFLMFTKPSKKQFFNFVFLYLVLTSFDKSNDQKFLSDLKLNSTSFINFTRSSLYFICLICKVFMWFAITPLTGIKIIITANPARTDGPAKNTISYTKVLTGSMIAILVSSSNMKLMYTIISFQDF